MKINFFKIIFCIIILIFIFYIIFSYKYLSPYELSNAILGKIAVHQSLSDPNRLYKIKYNFDKTFSMETIENGKYIGTTSGYFKIINKYNIGYIDINYIDIKESPYPESTFNSQNINSIYKTRKNMLGPFIMHYQENRSGNILEYKTDYSQSKNKYMTIYS
jgi:hypothetical protein